MKSKRKVSSLTQSNYCENLYPTATFIPQDYTSGNK